MKREIIETGDGSHSLYVPELDETYHSRHGALQESLHVFIEMGWKAVLEGKNEIRVLEIGFGTGLNALLTCLAAARDATSVQYMGIEAFPLTEAEVEALNYAEFTGMENATSMFRVLHAAGWEQRTTVGPAFELLKMKAKIEEFELDAPVDLIYFDAFAPNKQPELWTEEIFEKMFRMTNPGGILVTYCAKGDVRRAMQAAGYVVEKLPGPPGKREMLRGRRPE